MDSFDQNKHKEALQQIFGSNTPEFEEVSLKEKINVGCNSHNFACSDCCSCHSSFFVPMIAFDFYNMNKQIEEDNLAKLNMSNFKFYYGNNSHSLTASISTSSDLVHKCPFFIITKDGYECMFKDRKPITCRTQFLSTALDLSSMPREYEEEDEKAEMLFDHDYVNNFLNEYVNQDFSEKMSVFYNTCVCKKQNNLVTVEEYLKDRIVYEKEILLSHYLVSILYAVCNVWELEALANLIPYVYTLSLELKDIDNVRNVDTIMKDRNRRSKLIEVASINFGYNVREESGDFITDVYTHLNQFKPTLLALRKVYTSLYSALSDICDTPIKDIIYQDEDDEGIEMLLQEVDKEDLYNLMNLLRVCDATYLSKIDV